MGKKAKSSRKGKKAWRANISTEDIEDFYEKSTKDALSGGSLANVPSNSLFYVDNSRDLSVKRKIEKHREKVLHCDSVLQRNPFIQIIPYSKQNKSKKEYKEFQPPKIADQDSQKDNGESGMVNIWGDKGETNVKRKKKAKQSIIPAVEVEPPGCSFNPSSESHQDSLARAVADEMQKVYRNELGPEPIPQTVPGEVVNEEDMFFLEADTGSDEENPDEGVVKDGDMDPNQSEEIPAALKAYREIQKEMKLDNDFTGAVFERNFYGPEEFEALETLPSRAEVYARILGSLKGPASAVVGTLQAPARNLVMVLQAYVKKLEEGGGVTGE